MSKGNLRLRAIIPALLLGCLANSVLASSGESTTPWRPVVMEVDAIILQAQSGKRILPESPDSSMNKIVKKPKTATGLAPERYAAMVSRADEQSPRDSQAAKQRVEMRSYRLHF